MSLETGFLVVNKKRYEIVTIDFETFYSKEFTLSGKTINTSEYIRDDRFHAHGVSIKRGNRKTHWYTGKNIALALAEIDWAKSAMLAHNTPFDGFICSHHFKILPAFYLDTLSMARAAHSHHMRHDLNTIAIAHGLAGKTKRAALADTKGKLVLTVAESRALGAYCIDDDEDTYKIFWKLVDNIPDDELRLIDITVRMFCDPVLDVDLPRVRAELEKEIGGKQTALINSGADVVGLMSNDKFAALLAEAGAKLPMKISPSTGKMTYAFAKSDLDFQALSQSSNAEVVALCAARLKVKSTIGETRAVRFLEAGRDGMKLPVMLNYSGAHTHRWSGGNKCLVGDTQITVLREDTVSDILLSRLLLTDEVWDGEEFVKHEGLIYQGVAKTISYDGITGTPDHEVFTAHGKKTLSEAHRRGIPIINGNRPSNVV